MADIHKAAGIIVQNRKLLVLKEYDEDFYKAPGGSLHGESVLEALMRELKEEIDIDITELDVEPFGKFEAKAAGEEDKWLLMEAFTVKRFKGTLKPSGETEAMAWVSSNNEQNLKLGSIFEHDVIPRLKAEGLID